MGRVVIEQDRDQHLIVSSERDLLLNVVDRGLVLCTALLDHHRVERLVTSMDSAWTVGESASCPSSRVHRHWALTRK